MECRKDIQLSPPEGLSIREGGQGEGLPHPSVNCSLRTTGALEKITLSLEKRTKIRKPMKRWWNWAKKSPEGCL